VRTANHVRFSRSRINRLARCANARKQSSHRRGEGKPARPYFWKMATWRTTELQLRCSHERGVKKMRSKEIDDVQGTIGPIAIRALAVGAQSVGAIAVGALALSAIALGFIAIGRLVVGRAKIKRLEIGELRVTRLHVTDSIIMPPQAR
jgi:hypothetical protein